MRTDSNWLQRWLWALLVGLGVLQLTYFAVNSDGRGLDLALGIVWLICGIGLFLDRRRRT